MCGSYAGIVKAFALLTAAVLVAIGIGIGVVTGLSEASLAHTSPPPGDVRLTAFATVSISGSSGVTTITPSQAQAAEILRALDTLPGVPALSCHENALVYSLAIHLKGRRPSALAVNGWECASTVAEIEAGHTTWLYDKDCLLLDAVKAAIPPHEAEGTLESPCVTPRG